MLFLLPMMVEGGGCAVMVDAGVMVGVVAAMMAEGEEAALGEKKREKNCNNLCYLKINLNVPQQLLYVYYRKQLHLQ